jgi:hypothetical protein
MCGSRCRPHVCRPMKSATIPRIHSVISSVLDLAVRYEWTDRNVSKNGRPPHPRKRERVDEPVVADEPGGDDLLPARGEGDRAVVGVIPEGFRVRVAVRVVAEFTKHPGAEDGSKTYGHVRRLAPWNGSWNGRP